MERLNVQEHQNTHPHIPQEYPPTALIALKNHVLYHHYSTHKNVP